MTVFALNPCVLLRRTHATHLMNNSLFTIELFYRIGCEFHSSITPNHLYLSSQLSYSHFTKISQKLRCLTLFFHEMNPPPSTSIIHNSQKVLSATKRFYMIRAPYVTMMRSKQFSALFSPSENDIRVCVARKHTSHKSYLWLAMKLLEI